MSKVSVEIKVRRLLQIERTSGQAVTATEWLSLAQRLAVDFPTESMECLELALDRLLERG